MVRKWNHSDSIYGYYVYKRDAATNPSSQAFFLATSFPMLLLVLIVTAWFLAWVISCDRPVPRGTLSTRLEDSDAFKPEEVHIQIIIPFLIFLFHIYWILLTNSLDPYFLFIETHQFSISLVCFKLKMYGNAYSTSPFQLKGQNKMSFHWGRVRVLSNSFLSSDIIMEGRWDGPLHGEARWPSSWMEGDNMWSQNMDCGRSLWFSFFKFHSRQMMIINAMEEMINVCICCSHFLNFIHNKWWL